MFLAGIPPPAWAQTANTALVLGTATDPSCRPGCERPADEYFLRIHRLLCITSGLFFSLPTAERGGAGHSARFWHTDPRLVIGKETRFHEGYAFEISADFFNAFNHPIFLNPNLDLTNLPTFGVVSSTLIPPTEPPVAAGFNSACALISSFHRKLRGEGVSSPLASFPRKEVVCGATASRFGRRWSLEKNKASRPGGRAGTLFVGG